MRNPLLIIGAVMIMAAVSCGNNQYDNDTTDTTTTSTPETTMPPTGSTDTTAIPPVDQGMDTGMNNNNAVPPK